MYAETELEGEPFTYHGTGLEMFIGFVQVIACIAGLAGTIYLLVISMGLYGLAIGGLLLFACMLFATPYAMHGSLRYNTSRTSWKGTHFGYRGKLSELSSKFILGYFLTVITAGIYGSWFVQSLKKYTISNIRFGNFTFEYKGDGLSYFWLNLKGILLTVFTLGIYFFWYNKDVFNYYIKNISANQKGQEISFHSTLTGGDLFVHGLTNALLIVFTFGLGFPWAIVRSLRFVYSNIVIEGNFDANSLENTEEEYKDAAADSFADMMDVAM